MRPSPYSSGSQFQVSSICAASSPGAAPYVQVGDRISEGDTLCIIEAMKVMNEIRADASGTICEICVDDSSPVQYGDMLFRLK